VEAQAGGHSAAPRDVDAHSQASPAVRPSSMRESEATCTGQNDMQHDVAAVVVAGDQRPAKAPSRQASSREKEVQQQQRETVSDEEALLASLSARSLTGLRSMHADADELLQQMDQLPQQDVNEALSARARTNMLAAAALNDSQVTVTSNDRCDPTLSMQDGDEHASMATARTRERLQGLVDESATLLESLDSGSTLNILDTLRDSAGSSPLATLLYAEILQARVPASITSNPPAMKRALSAKTRRTLDALLADGKKLMKQLPESESESVLNVLAQHASSSPLASVLLYETLNQSDSTSSNLPHDHHHLQSSPPASARTRAALADLMREGDQLLSKIKQDQAQSLFQTLTESAQNSPLAALVMSQVPHLVLCPATNALLFYEKYIHASKFLYTALHWRVETIQSDCHGHVHIPYIHTNTHMAYTQNEHIPYIHTHTHMAYTQTYAYIQIILKKDDSIRLSRTYTIHTYTHTHDLHTNIYIHTDYTKESRRIDSAITYIHAHVHTYTYIHT
jgi:hypothetical protein